MVHKKNQKLSTNVFIVMSIKKIYRDLPGGLVIKTLPSNAGGTVSIPGPGAMIPHVSPPLL